MPSAVTASYIDNATSLFHYYQQLAEGAIAQVPDAQLSAALDPRMNSIAVMVKHLAGNMRSRWTDFLTTDGEKPFRDKKGEFQNSPVSREELMRQWAEGWACAFTALKTLSDADLGTIITIRGEPHTVLQAINRQLTHCAYHVGQIAFMAKHLNHERWEPLKVQR